MRTVLFLFFFILTSNYTVLAQQKPYDASLISKDLLPYASAVVRNQQIDIEVKDINTTIYHFKKAITILNKNGDNMARLVVFHDKITSIKYIKGTIFNEFGIQTAKFSESDFEDANTTDGFSLFEDVKVKHYTPSVTVYPYTIEYEYEQKIKQSLEFPQWQPNDGIGIAVEKSVLTFTCNPDFNIRYKETNMPTSVDIQHNKDATVYTWQVANLKAIKYEPYRPNNQDYLISIKIAPEQFSYYGINGSFNNWQQLGKWEYDNLVSTRQELPIGTKDHMVEITKDITDPKLKAKKIYEYVQTKTHYVSVQVGIGGVQPFLASEVDAQNYGDCKALVNYTQALLKAVNIESYYCVVEANHDGEAKVGFLPDFASMDQGNHIILCLPFKNDTTWCDCTNQTIPFGYLGSFTDDRYVLACTPNGGELLHTPKYTAHDNLELRKINLTINATGDINGNMLTDFKGITYPYREGIIMESGEERLKSIAALYAINNINISRLDYTQNKGMNPVTTENMDFKAPEYGSVTGNKILFLLNPVNRITTTPKELRNRTSNVYISEGYTDEDEVTYTLPAGYHPDANLLNINIKKDFGTFKVSTVVIGDQLIYKRRLQVKDGTYPKDMYQEVVDFYQSVEDADSYNFTITKN